MRTSKYKKNILEILAKSHLLSMSDIHGQLPEADFSTVFRNVEQLVAEGAIKKLVLDKGNILYEVVDGHAHDHFLCNGCGVVESIHLEQRISLKGKAVAQDVLVRGVCEDCNC